MPDLILDMEIVAPGWAEVENALQFCLQFCRNFAHIPPRMLLRLQAGRKYRKSPESWISCTDPINSESGYFSGNETLLD